MVRGGKGVRLVLSPLQNAHAQCHAPADAAGRGASRKYAQFIRPGFAPADRDGIADAIASAGLAEVRGGVVFRIPRGASPAAETAKAVDWSARSGVPARLMIRLAGDNPAGLATDDGANAMRVPALTIPYHCARIGPRGSDIRELGEMWNAMKDASLQPERTSLSSSRTGLATMLVALLSVRMGLSAFCLFHLSAAVLPAAAAGAMWYRGHRHTHPGAGAAVIARRARNISALISMTVAAAATFHCLALLIRLR
ncbi:MULTISPECIES: hypothetical protein [unclassified Xanthobacter]|uniref:hypothetical protein n=1 Tax=unclassified Xanthobacter TaxID=2623496 RepID=UPI001EDF5B5B|nr:MULTISPECIES: hypothetical protein [unclassified Xanthobacter]